MKLNFKNNENHCGQYLHLSCCFFWSGLFDLGHGLLLLFYFFSYSSLWWTLLLSTTCSLSTQSGHRVMAFWRGYSTCKLVLLPLLSLCLNNQTHSQMMWTVLEHHNKRQNAFPVFVFCVTHSVGTFHPITLTPPLPPHTQELSWVTLMSKVKVQKRFPRICVL